MISVIANFYIIWNNDITSFPLIMIKCYLSNLLPFQSTSINIRIFLNELFSPLIPLNKNRIYQSSYFHQELSFQGLDMFTYLFRLLIKHFSRIISTRRSLHTCTIRVASSKVSFSVVCVEGALLY